MATENKLIVRSKGKAFELDGNLSSSILANDDRFFNVLENFSADEQESPDAMALADAYSDIFEQFAEEINDKVFRLQNFSCGHSLCLGSVSATPPSDAYPKFDAWSQFNDYINNTGETFNTSVRVTFMIGDELVEYRFFFSTDPAIHGITMPPPDDY